MMYKVATSELPQKGLLLVVASYTFELLYFNIQLFALDDIPSGVFAEVAGERSSQKMKKPPPDWQLHFNEP